MKQTQRSSSSSILSKWRKRKNSAKYMRKRFKRLKVDMQVMRKEQQSIKAMQSQVGGNLQAIDEECEQLRIETNQIIRQTANTQTRLVLMFNILKAREQGDFAKAAQLTQLLRIERARRLGKETENRMTLFHLRHLHPVPAINKKCYQSRIKLRKKRLERKEMRRRLVELKVEMEAISEEQKTIKEGQRQVGQKLEAIEEECQKLKEETKVIIKQSTQTQLRLALMFQILKAREENDFTKAAQLTHLLREIIAATSVSS